MEEVEPVNEEKVSSGAFKFYFILVSSFVILTIIITILEKIQKKNRRNAGVGGFI